MDGWMVEENDGQSFAARDRRQTNRVELLNRLVILALPYMTLSRFSAKEGKVRRVGVWKVVVVPRNSWLCMENKMIASGTPPTNSVNFSLLL